MPKGRKQPSHKKEVEKLEESLDAMTSRAEINGNIAMNLQEQNDRLAEFALFVRRECGYASPWWLKANNALAGTKHWVEVRPASIPEASP